MTTLQAPALPALTGTDRWATVSPVESERTSEHRHIVAESNSTSLCGITAIPAVIWRLDRSKPVCPACVAHHENGTTNDARVNGRVVIQRVRRYGRVEIEEMRILSQADKAATLRANIRKHVPTEHAEAVIALVESGALVVRENEVNVDKHGSYEDERGSCTREVDDASKRTVTYLTFHTPRFEADGSPFTTTPGDLHSEVDETPGETATATDTAAADAGDF